MTRAIAAMSLLLLGSCERSKQVDPVSMSVIGTTLKISDPNMGAVGISSKTLLIATAQGLVSRDASGQIAPGLAKRWIVTDDGLSHIFRIRPAHWPDKLIVTSQDVSRSLKRSIAADGRNPLRGLLSNVAAVIPMTPEVIEIRLRRPDPHFLQLLAQPEMAILRSGGGTGPFRVHSRRGDVMRLRPIPEEDSDETQAIDDTKDVRIRSEAASVAITRFAEGQIDYVTGGSFVDAPLLTAAKADVARIKIDPTNGLFGLLVARNSPLLSAPQMRLALSLAIDRESLSQRMGIAEWRSMVSLVPLGLDLNAPPAALVDLQQPITARRNAARSLVKSERKGSDPIKIKVAFPSGPGAHLLFATLQSDWKRIGVDAVRVPAGQIADLRLIDEVAPTGSPLWYLQRMSCHYDQLCSPAADEKLAAALVETDPARRRELIAAADTELAQDNVFLPIAQPYRWSLVSADLTSWRKSGFAVHPLELLR